MTSEHARRPARKRRPRRPGRSRPSCSAARRELRVDMPDPADALRGPDLLGDASSQQACRARARSRPARRQGHARLRGAAPEATMLALVGAQFGRATGGQCSSGAREAPRGLMPAQPSTNSAHEAPGARTLPAAAKPTAPPAPQTGSACSGSGSGRGGRVRPAGSDERQRDAGAACAPASSAGARAATSASAARSRAPAARRCSGERRVHPAPGLRVRPRPRGCPADTRAAPRGACRRARARTTTGRRRAARASSAIVRPTYLPSSRRAAKPSRYQRPAPGPPHEQQAVVPLW